MRPRHYLQGLLMLALAQIGLWLAVEVVTLDAPVYSGTLFLDYADPDTGHLKGVVVSLPEVLTKSILAVVCLVIAVRLWRSLWKLGNWSAGD